jgi:hypothetical protein
MKSVRSSRVRFGITAISSLLALAVQPLYALDNWIRTPLDGTGLWTDGLNWSNGLPPNGTATPGGNEEGRIDNNGIALVDDSQIDPFSGIMGDIVTGSLTLGSQPGASGNFLMTSGKFTLRNTDLRIGGNPVTAIGGGVPTIGGVGMFTLTGGTYIQQGGNVNVGIRGDNTATEGVAIGMFNMSGDSSLTVMFGFIFVIGNRANGTVNQTGGTIEIKNLAASNGGTLGSIIQLGRNALNNTSYTSGTYNLSGGSATAALFRFGHAAQTSGSSLNTFNLSGTGALRTGTIEFLNTTTATNIFNFTGGTLSANTVSIPVTNDGGTLRPYFADFATVTQFNSVSIIPVGTMLFSGSNSYTQTSKGNLAIDLDFFSNDLVDIGSAGDGTANIAGKISVNFLNGFDPTLGSIFDIVIADTITNTAAVIGRTPSGNYFQPSIVAAGDGRQILRLTVIPPPTTYAGWQAIYQAGSFTDDDDLDGLYNGLEYMLGTVPKDGNGANGLLPVVGSIGAGATQRMNIAFSVAEPSGTDATLEVQASNDLGVTDPWTAIASKVGQGPWTGAATVSVFPAQDGKTPVTVDDTVLVSAASHRFLRLRALLP